MQIKVRADGALALLPQRWRDWVGDTVRATGAPADYVLQSVLAGVAVVCGAGVVSSCVGTRCSQSPVEGVHRGAMFRHDGKMERVR